MISDEVYDHEMNKEDAVFKISLPFEIWIFSLFLGLNKYASSAISFGLLFLLL